MLTIATLLLIATAGFLSFALAQTPTASAEKQKEEALLWLDRFARVQVLFHVDDVKKLRERVAAMSPAEAALWWEKTAPQREVLTSPQWRDTERWLREFLEVQAKYSDEDIRYFQSEAAAKAKESAASLQEVLDRITQARRRLIGAGQVSEQTRQMQLAANQAYKQEQVRQREESLRKARSQPAATFPTPPAPRQYPTRYSDPLIDSLDVARWTVLQQLFPNW
jgi:hypothetical protein